VISWDSVTNLIKEASPILGAAVSASNPLAGVAISLISHAFGANKDDPQDLLDKINGDPDFRIKLKKIELEHKSILAQANAENYKTEVEDRKSARTLQINTNSFIPTFLAIGYFFSYSLLQFYCLMHPAQTNDIICARLHDGFMIVLAYFFGSNHKQFSQK